MSQTKEEMLTAVRSKWADLLDDGDDLTIEIEMLTLDGQPGQPLAFDMIQRRENEPVTYTCVEVPEQVERGLGLADVTYDQAIQTLQNLLTQARATTLATYTQDVHGDAAAPDLASFDTTLTGIVHTEEIGITYGRHLVPSAGGLANRPLPFETNYQAFFTTSILLTLQEQQAGVRFNRLTATLDSSDQLSIRFGA